MTKYLIEILNDKWSYKIKFFNNHPDEVELRYDDDEIERRFRPIFIDGKYDSFILLKDKTE